MWLRVLAAALLLLVVAAPAFAQGRFECTDEVGNITCSEIERAARPLLNRGAEIAVYMVRQGSDADFEQRLRNDGFISGNQARLKMLALYVGFDNRISAIRFGDEWNPALAVNDNVDNIRQANLNRYLAAGEPTRAFAETFSAVENAVVNPPGNPIISTLPIVIGVFILVGLFVTWQVVGRQRAAAKALANAQKRHEEAKRDAGVLITDLGQRLRKIREQAEFDRVSYAPADVEDLARRQQEFAVAFADVQSDFDDVGEKFELARKPDVAKYDATAQNYQKLQERLKTLQAQLAAIGERRAELDELARRAPEEIDRAKKS